MIQKLRELYSYREMTASLVRKDLKGRYKGSVLGFLWTFLNPLLQLLIYTAVFSVILKSGIPHYSLHLFAALVPWIYFASALTSISRVRFCRSPIRSADSAICCFRFSRFCR